jgi:catecholate siderophore receptor
MKMRSKNYGKSRKRNKKGSWKQRSKNLAAVGAMSALLAVGPVDSKAETRAGGGLFRRAIWESVYADADPQPQRFDISAATVGEVIEAFQKVTGIKVQITDDKIRSLASPGVSGVYTPEQALSHLLANTGLSYRVDGPKLYTLQLKGVDASVEIIGKEAPASMKYTEPLRDIPQTISIVPRAIIEEQGATTLRDVLRNVPGLTIAAGEGGVPAGDNLTLRGFSARNDVFVDGVRDLGPQSRDPFNLEQVEVAKGPNSAYNGRGSAGGTINLVSKSPGLDRFYGGTLNFGSDSTKRLTGDVNVPLKSFGMGERTAFRMNALWHQSGVAGRDVVENERWGLAPSLAFGVGTRTRLTLNYFKTKQDNIPDYGIPWVTATHNVLAAFRDQPAPVDRDNYYGLENRDRERLNSDMATVKFERDFADALSFRTQFRYGRGTRDSITSAPRFASNDTLVINRNSPSWITKDEIYDSQTDLRARFSTGKLDHAMIVGAAFTRESNIRKLRVFSTPAPATDLYNPDPSQPYTGVISIHPNVGDVKADSQAVYLLDTVKFGQKFELNGSLRYDRFDASGVLASTTALTPVARVDEMVSWRAGAIYKPLPFGSFYASYGTSLSPSLEGLSYNTANTAIEPEKTFTYEFGTKWDVINQRLSLSGAVFRVEKTNARTPGVLPDDPVQVLQGNQRVIGLELGASGTITRRWLLFGAYTLLDSEITKSNTAAEVGRTFQNTPRNSFSVWNSYRTPWRLTVGGGPRFVGKRFGNNINTRFVDSYWTLDGMASYSLTEYLDIRVNFYNLNNEYYFDRLGGGHLIPGAGRSVNVSTSFKF